MSYKNSFLKNDYPFFPLDKVLAEKFLKTYEAICLPSDKMMYARRQPYHYAEITDLKYSIEREPYYEINIPQHRFKELVDRDRYTDELEETCRKYRIDLQHQMLDADVRATNATVKKAWDKYNILLELAR